MLRDTYANLTPWQKTQVARHPERPHFKDLVSGLFDEFVPLGGDRNFGDDQAIIGGFAKIGDMRLVVIGHEKGDDTESRLRHNFGMGKPEGYRKAIRLMDIADRFSLPVVTLVDTSGAFPGVSAEERGQAEAIARSTEKCLSLGVPMVAVIVGEGGSGGCSGAGGCRTGFDAGARRVFRHISGRLCFDPMAYWGQSGRSGRCHENHGAKSQEAWRDRPDSERARGRSASRSKPVHCHIG